MLVFKFGADLVTFNHAAGLLPLFYFWCFFFLWIAHVVVAARGTHTEHRGIEVVVRLTWRLVFFFFLFPEVQARELQA